MSEEPRAGLASVSAWLTEFRFNDRIIEKDLEWVHGSLTQDNLYVDMTFVKVLDTVGLDVTSAEIGGEFKNFKNAKYQLWHANLAVRRTLPSGHRAPHDGWAT